MTPAAPPPQVPGGADPLLPPGAVEVTRTRWEELRWTGADRVVVTRATGSLLDHITEQSRYFEVLAAEAGQATADPTPPPLVEVDPITWAEEPGETWVWFQDGVPVANYILAPAAVTT